MNFDHNINKHEHNKLSVGEFQLSVFPRLFDFCIVISDSESRKNGEYRLQYNVGSEYRNVQAVFSLIYTVLQQESIRLEDLPEPMNASTITNESDIYKELQSLLVNPNAEYPLINILSHNEILNIELRARTGEGNFLDN